MNNKNKKKYFFVDESGDPYFFNRKRKCIVGEEGCSKVLILGFISTENPHELRQDICKLKREIEEDQYLCRIPSIKKSLMSFHAKNDCPEIREKFFKLIIKLKFQAQFIVARKLRDVFLETHRGKPNIFYDDLISKLFNGKLHKSDENMICFSHRGGRERQKPLEEAIKKSVAIFEKSFNKKVTSKINISSNKPSSEPCLQIIDYMSWAIQRAFIRGEDRYYDFVKDKVQRVWDIYDFKNHIKFRNDYYKNNKFDVNKISPI